jgi:hypothetical protein
MLHEVELGQYNRNFNLQPKFLVSNSRWITILAAQSILTFTTQQQEMLVLILISKKTITFILGSYVLKAN